MTEVTVICPKCSAEYSIPLLGQTLARKLGVECLCGEPLFGDGQAVETGIQSIVQSLARRT
jgi:hypothetical protein